MTEVLKMLEDDVATAIVVRIRDGSNKSCDDLHELEAVRREQMIGVVIALEALSIAPPSFWLINLMCDRLDRVFKD